MIVPQTATVSGPKTKTVRARIPAEMYAEFMALAVDPEEDTESKMLRVAIRQFIASRDPKKAKAAKVKADSDDPL